MRIEKSHPTAAGGTPYRSAWSRCTAVLAAQGLGLAFLLWSPWATLQEAAVLTAAGAVMVCLVSPGTIRTWGIPGIAAVSAHAAAGCLALAAYGALSPVLALLLGAGTLATAPAVRRLLARAHPAGRPVREARLDELTSRDL